MENIQNIISVHNRVLASNVSKEIEGAFDLNFAIARFKKKFQEPNVANVENLKFQTQELYLSNDRRLPITRTHTYRKVWYLVRKELEKALSNYRDGEFSFPVGSEYTPNRGQNSLEYRLSGSDWSCTYENFDQFFKIVQSHKGLKTSLKKRFKRLCRSKGLSLSRVNHLLYNKFKNREGFPSLILKFKLWQVTNLVTGSRFSSVPKNNEKRRPINIEPFANILSQSSIGAGIRRVLLDYYGQDLNHTQDKHKELIKQTRYATIDLADASDSISLDLCRFLFPKWFFMKLCRARSPVVFFNDNHEGYPLRKISSMGNGFTFELMTLILTALCRVYSSDSSVYGDDIIIPKEFAPDLILDLEDVCFRVNKDKSFIDGPFRESCGGNFHDDHGYIISYDIKWAENIMDMMMNHNKIMVLSQKHEFFRKIARDLCRNLPKFLWGGPCSLVNQANKIDLTDMPFTLDFPPYFVTPPTEGLRPKNGREIGILNDLQLRAEDWVVIQSFRFVGKQRSSTISKLTSRHWAKYLMYLASGMIVNDQITGAGRWVKFTLLSDGHRIIRSYPSETITSPIKPFGRHESTGKINF